MREEIIPLCSALSEPRVDHCTQFCSLYTDIAKLELVQQKGNKTGRSWSTCLEERRWGDQQHPDKYLLENKVRLILTHGRAQAGG